MTKPAKVLIADDVEAICALIQNFLPTAAFETRVASDGSAALEICRQWRPEVILLDIMMPIMSGFEVLKAIRAEAEALAGEQAEEGGPVIIMLTSRSSKDDVLSCSRIGIDGYLVKPINAKSLHAAIITGLAKHDPARARTLAELMAVAPDMEGANRRRLR